jgi:biopolymer transport protein ExbB/TolQ
MITYLLDAFTGPGAGFMWAITAVMAFGLAVFIERCWVATMLGLLGTVYGLILAFSALGDTSAGERAVQLSEGISTAMATTAYGLLVGIPALAVHAWLEAQARAALAQIEASAGRLAARLRAGEQ